MIRENNTNTGQIHAGHRIELIAALFEPTDKVLIRPIEAWSEGGRKCSKVDWDGIQYLDCGLQVNGKLMFSIEGVSAALTKQCERAEKTKTNIFFGVCPRLGVDGKFDKAWQIRTVRTLWADIDDTDPIGAKKRIETAKLPPPSILISSGNGAHVYWQLDEPYIVDDVPDPAPVLKEWVEYGNGKKPREYIERDGQRLYLNQRRNVPELSAKALAIQDVIKGIASQIGGDHTQDLSRLLRVPGTFNRKDERNGRQPTQCQIVELHHDRRYSIDEFKALSNRSPDKHRQNTTSKDSPPLINSQTEAPLVESSVGVEPDEHLDVLLEKCRTDDRSKADFALCCEAIRRGWDKQKVWERVKDESKFAERRQTYFDDTWKAAAKKVGNAIKATSETITNGRMESIGDGKYRTIPLTMKQVLADIRTQTGDWPRRVGNLLFVHDSYGVHWLENPSATFGWLGNVAGCVRWRTGSGCVTKPETHAELVRTSVSYESVETLPHEPRIADCYYAYPDVEPTDGRTLRALLDRFNPATDIDRDLMEAAFLTPFWGGPPGARPVFVVDSDDGRGAGKSQFAAMVCRVAGGCVDISQHEDFSKIKTRLLSSDAITKRCCLLDNVKSLRFSWGELEGLITAPVISGHRLYAGEGTRPNAITWFITLNGASLSTDMAQRSVVVKVKKPPYNAAWLDEVRGFIADNHPRIIADIIAALRTPADQLQRFSRWGAWERDVLARLPEPSDAQKVIAERQSGVDVEEEEAWIIEDFFASRLTELNYDVARDVIHLPNAVVTEWFNRATNERYKTTSVTRLLSQLASEGRAKRIAKNPSRTYGRGFLWMGAECDPSSPTQCDIEERIERRSG